MQQTYVDFLEVLVLQVQQRLNEVLLHRVLHGILHLSKLLVRLSRLKQGLTLTRRTITQQTITQTHDLAVRIN